MDPEIEYGKDIQIETAIKTTIHPDFNSRTFIENNIAVVEVLIYFIKFTYFNLYILLNLFTVITLKFFLIDYSIYQGSIYL